MNSTNRTGKIHMIISDGETRTYYCRGELYDKGFRFIRKDEKWHRDTTDPLFVEKYRDYAKGMVLPSLHMIPPERDATATEIHSLKQTNR